MWWGEQRRPVRVGHAKTAHEARRRFAASRFLRVGGHDQPEQAFFRSALWQARGDQFAVELLLAIKRAGIRDAKLRDEALRAAKSAVLNVAEGTGRVSRADKARAFAIARGEGLEAFAALETAGLVGDVDGEHVERCLPIAGRLYALLTGLLR